MAILEVSIIPIGTGAAGVSEYVTGCLRVLKETPGVKYRLTPMATVIEGELEQIMPLALKMHEQPFLKGINRVVTTIRIDDRRDKPVSMEGKVAVVEEKLSR